METNDSASRSGTLPILLKKLHDLGIFTALVVGAAVVATSPVQAGNVRLVGSSSFGGGSTGGAGALSNPPRLSSGDDGAMPFLNTHNRKPLYKHGPQLPNPSSTQVTQPDASYAGFAGLNIWNQLLADDGNQFWIEPPDQALAVGNGYVLEAVNTTMAVFDKSGALLAAPTSLNQFFTHDHQYDVAAGTYGAFLSDPSAYYDPAVRRWFMSVTEIDQDPVTGAFDPGHTSVMLAVSQTSNPTGAWWIYAVDTTDLGLADYPMLGTDANGVYITVNAFPFPIETSVTTGAYIYALQKSALIAGSASANLVRVGSLLNDSGVGLQPATIPPGGTFSTSGGGIEYFMSTLDLDGTLDNQIKVWALSNTSSLNNATPNLSLAQKVVGTQDYGFPPPAEQHAGPNPLGELIGEPLEKIASNDDAMHQVVYANGMLWGAAHTVVKSSKQQLRTGVAYFVVQPSWSGGNLQASVVKQGYVSVQNNSCLMPSLGVTASGLGVMTFTVVGPDYYPTAAYARIDSKHGAGKAQAVASGGVPLDGFSGYSVFLPPDVPAGVARWGDYSACAVDDATGEVWFAGEVTIPGPTSPDDPTYPWLTNWGTHVGHVKP
jgi:hypothetical protein